MERSEKDLASKGLLKSTGKRETKGSRPSHSTPPPESVDEETGLQDSATEPICPEEPPVVKGNRHKTGGDSDEVFVILPDDEGDASQLPVVETVAVDDEPWGTGPSTTDVLNEVPGGEGEAAEDVSLLKTNPLSENAGETEVLPEDFASASLPHGSDEEIKVIDEIAGLAQDLEAEELPPPPEPRMSMPHGHYGSPRRQRRVVVWVVAAALAAAVPLGLFYFPQIEQLYKSLTGREAVATAAGRPGGRPTVNGGGAVRSEEAAALHELRTRIELALRVGLRADAGKE